MILSLLKAIGIVLIALFVINGARYMFDRARAYRFKKKHNHQLRDCKKEKEKLDE